MGILARNLKRGGGLARSVEYGVDFLIPPNDEQFIVASTPLSSASADANFPFAAPFEALGRQLPWPCRLFIVLRNRGAAGKPPNITQSSATFSGSETIRFTITGSLNGKAQTEIVDATGITTPISDGDRQREHLVTEKFWDQIDSIHHKHLVGGVASYGETTPLQVSVGLGEAEHGEASHKSYRMQILAPNELPSVGSLRRVVQLPDSQPTDPARWAKFGAFTTQLGASTLTLASHGLANGTAVRLKALVALPGPLAENTTYYVVSTAANTLQLASSIGGTAITFAAASGYADGDTVGVYTMAEAPVSWPIGGPVSNTQGDFTVDITADTLTKTAHGLPNGTPIRLSTGGSLGSGPWTTSDTADTLTKVGHGIPNAAQVKVVDLGSGVPAPLNTQTTYFVVGTAADTLQLSLTQGGAAIDITGTDRSVGLTRLSVLPTGTTSSTTYYVIGATANAFQISASLGGAAVNMTSQTNGVVGVAVIEHRANLNNESNLLLVPGSVPAPFTTMLGRATITDVGDTVTIANHGLVNGNTVRFQDAGDGFPTGISPNTTYYVVGVTGTTPDVFQIALTPGGTAITITAAGDFATTEELICMRPTHVWRRGRMIYSDKETVG